MVVGGQAGSKKVDGSGKILFGFPEVSRVFVFPKFVKIHMRPRRDSIKDLRVTADR
jgi:hypothetical protein